MVAAIWKAILQQMRALTTAKVATPVASHAVGHGSDSDEDNVDTGEEERSRRPLSMSAMAQNLTSALLFLRRCCGHLWFAPVLDVCIGC